MSATPLSAETLLSSRCSNSKLIAPAPSASELDEIITWALRAPDHGALRPHKIFRIEGEGRTKWGELMAQAEKRKNPSLSKEDENIFIKKAFRAPMILVVACAPVASPKIPEVEQLLSTGCVAHTLLYGLQARGFGAIWRTGSFVYEDATKSALGLRTNDHIVAALYVGTPAHAVVELPRPKSNDFLVDWP